MKLTNISLIGNRVTGSLPKELANIAPLQELVLEYNQLSGTIPPEFGSLTQIKRLLFSSNNLTGELPPDLAKLTTLTDFRISDNSFIGSIPNFIQNWTNITKLVIQASGLTGPIPAGIASLTKLSDLRISDLNGNIESAFPSLNKMSSMDTLILRSCNIVGELPEDFGEMKIKNVFDLSFNNLTGQIPDSYVFLENTSHIYLTGNSLTGKLPNWMSNLGSVDLSYNNINITSGSSPPNCRGPNLFANSRGNTPGTFSCLKINCRPTYHYFHINCGGSQSFRDENGFIYEEDPDSAGASDFFQSYSNWGFSTTGRFMDGEGHRYTLQNSSSISGPDSKLYMDARLSPLSLTYYGFCLINGKYRVELHFAEIKFTDDRTYRSLGRRIFDVYIQGTQVLKDFNIENKADGVNKPVIEQFTAAVTDNTLEIRFYWAGKGTQRIPDGGDYGPLVSAISAIRTDQKKGPKKIIIILVVVGFVIISICTYFSWKWIAKYRGMKQTIVLGNAGASGPVDTYLQDAFNEVNLEELPFYKFEILVNATNNFSEANKLGKGGFGSVYKGNMANGREIAVKRLSQASRQGVQEFMNELVLISKLQHRNLVKLLGCCVENNETMLIYEYMPNKSLDFFLFDQSQGILDWRKRFKIIEGICRGLLYLHRDSRLKIIHRDLKPSNILLDNDWNAKISDFGLARIFGTEQDHVSTVRVVGTYGYMAPEYVIEGKFSEKSDVFSFGVLILEIATGKRNKSFRQDGSLNLLGHVWKLWNEDGAAALIDKRISSSSYQAEVMRCIHIGLLCVQELPKDRPSILAVLSMLSSEIMELPEPKRSAFAIESSHSDTGTSSSQQSQKHSSSINNVTLTMVDDGR